MGIPGRYWMGDDPFTYTVSDGNGATDTATVNIQVKDTIAPDAPVITSPANNTTDTDGSFTISGTAEPYSQVEPKDGGLPVNQDDMASGAIAGPDGTWSIDLSNVSEGSHSYTVTSQDAAGNETESEAVTVIVDIP